MTSVLDVVASAIGGGAGWSVRGVTGRGAVSVGGADVGTTRVCASPRRTASRWSRTWAIVHRCSGSRTMVCSSTVPSGPASGSRGGSSWTIL